MILTTWSDLAADGTASLAEHVRLSLRTTTATSKTDIPRSTPVDYDLAAVTTAVLADLENHLPVGVTTDGTTFHLHTHHADGPECRLTDQRREQLIDELRDLVAGNPLRFWYLADTHHSTTACMTLSGDWLTDWLTASYSPAERLAAVRIALASHDRPLPHHP